MKLLDLLCRRAKKEGRSRQGDNPPTTYKKDKLRVPEVSRILPYITDPEVIARREARKRMLAEQARQLLKGGAAMSLSIELVEGSEYRINQEADSLPSITVGLYKAFMARGKTGFDALLVYMLLGLTYRLQSDNVVHADDVYLMQGLQIGERKLKAAKAILSRMGLIRYRQKRGAKGRMGQHLVELVLVPNPGPALPIRDLPGVAPLPPAEPMTATADAEETDAQAEEVVDFEESKGPQKRLFTHYYQLHKAKTGKFPKFTQADAVVLDKDLKLYGFESMKRYISWLFEHTPSRMTSYGIRGMGIHVFIPEALKAIAEQESKLRLVRVCPSCGKEQTSSDIDCMFCGRPMKEAANVG